LKGKTVGAGVFFKHAGICPKFDVRDVNAADPVAKSMFQRARVRGKLGRGVKDNWVRALLPFLFTFLCCSQLFASQK